MSWAEILVQRRQSRRWTESFPTEFLRQLSALTAFHGGQTRFLDIFLIFPRRYRTTSIQGGRTADASVFTVCTDVHFPMSVLDVLLGGDLPSVVAFWLVTDRTLRGFWLLFIMSCEFSSPRIDSVQLLLPLRDWELENLSETRRSNGWKSPLIVVDTFIYTYLYLEHKPSGA